MIRPKIQKEAKVRLFCFPYAGSSSVIAYRFLVDLLPDSIEICLVEFPGRGIRMGENLMSNLDLVVEQITAEIDDLADLPFIFFGHSMGALVSFELAKKLKSLSKQTPLKLYISSHRAPSYKKERLIHSLDEKEFTEELRNMNGMNSELYEHKELMEILLPIIRNDFKLCETYQYVENGKLNSDITVLGGKDDKDISKDQLEDWNEFTESNFDLKMFEGDHFYLINNNDEFVISFSKMLNKDINELAEL